MIAPKDSPALSREELLALVAELRASYEALYAEIEQLNRGGKRQSGPFAKCSRVAEPKSPGHKSSSGPFRYRRA